MAAKSYEDFGSASCVIFVFSKAITVTDTSEFKYYNDIFG